MTNYQWQYYGAVVVAMMLTGLGLIQVANPADFGLSPVGARWLAVAASMLGVLAGVLPSLRRPPVEHDDAGPSSSPDPQPRDGGTQASTALSLAEQVVSLSPRERLELQREVERLHAGTGEHAP